MAWKRLGEAWEERHRNVSFGSTPRAPGCNRHHQDYVPLLGLGIPRNLHVWLASWLGGRSNVSYASSTPQIRHRTKIEFCIFAGFHRHSWCFTDKKFRQRRVHTQVHKFHQVPIKLTNDQVLQLHIHKKPPASSTTLSQLPARQIHL